ncbi:hypothetical protein BGW42_005957 [Actinomortierella wolfii]|nr:hypothetical protein BGW42_005957 [Actinomortierella wolfii]
MPRLYPRTTLKKIIRAHEPDMKLSKTADIKVYVVYLLFLQRVVAEAARQAQLTRDSIIQRRHVARATQVKAMFKRM